jgi:hypothetical protein
MQRNAFQRFRKQEVDQMSARRPCLWSAAFILLAAMATTQPLSAQPVPSQPLSPAPAPATPLPMTLPGQTAVGQTLLSTPEAVRTCLCLEQAVNALAREVTDRKNAYDRQRDELNRLDAELASRRQTMNVNDPAEVAAYAQLYDRRNAAYDATNREAAGAYGSAVDRYNRRVADYNTTCANHAYDTTIVAQVRPTLSCPAP